MAAFPEPVLMKVEEFDRLPERDDVIQELHWGHLVEWGKPKAWHIDLQDRLARLLRERVSSEWAVLVELAFRAVPEYDVRSVDVGVVAKHRWKDAVAEGDLRGSPEILIEILSPSNRPGEMHQRASLVLLTGARQFCVVDRDLKQVRVTSPDSKTVAYGPGEEVPFPLLGISLAVNEIFA